MESVLVINFRIPLIDISERKIYIEITNERIHFANDIMQKQEMK